MSNQKGVTLLELVSCLLVIGVLSGIAIPAYKSWILRYRFRTETARVVHAINLAKSYAIIKKSPVVFLYGHDGYQVFIDDGAEGGKARDWIRQPGEKVIADGDLRGKDMQIDLGQSTFTGQRTRFSGTPAIKAGSLVLVGPNGEKSRIVLNLVGRVRVEKLM